MKTVAAFLAFLIPYGPYSYFLMLGFLLACGFGFPLPEDIILVTGGILSGGKVCNVWITNVICLIGVLTGDVTIFSAGRLFGPRLKSSWLFKRVMKPETHEKIEKIYKKYGDKVIFMGRFMPGLRMPIYLTSGIYKVKFLRFFILDGMAALISVPLWIWIGFVFGNNLERLTRKVHQFEAAIYSIIGAVIIFLIAHYFIRKSYSKS